MGRDLSSRRLEKLLLAILATIMHLMIAYPGRSISIYMDRALGECLEMKQVAFPSIR
jgi:hypothetical protein